MLIAGGYFFGTVPDGRIVQEIIFKQGKWPSYDKPMLKLKGLLGGGCYPFWVRLQLRDWRHCHRRFVLHHYPCCADTWWKNPELGLHLIFQ